MTVLGVAQSTALQMSVSEEPFARAQEDATLLEECAQTSKEHYTPWAWYNQGNGIYNLYNPYNPLFGDNLSLLLSPKTDSAYKFTTWYLKGVLETLSMSPGRGLRIM